MTTFKGQDLREGIRKKKGKNGEKEEKLVASVMEAKQKSVSKNESNCENQMPQRG